MHTDVKSSKNHQDSSRRWQKQKEAGSTRQKFESGKKEGQPCKRQKSEKKEEEDKKGRNDKRKNPNVEDLKGRKGRQGKVHEVPVAKEKCSENTAKPHLINKNTKREVKTPRKRRIRRKALIERNRVTFCRRKNKNMKIQGLLIAKCVVQAKKRRNKKSGLKLKNLKAMLQ